MTLKEAIEKERRQTELDYIEAVEHKSYLAIENLRPALLQILQLQELVESRERLEYEAVRDLLRSPAT